MSGPDADSAWKNGPDYRKALKQALDDAHAGKFSVLIVWALDRIVRDDESGAEAALRIFRQFRQRGCTVVSVKESWLNGAPEVQDIRESARRSERIKIGLAKRSAEGKPVGRQPGARDKARRKRAGYVASWESGRRRAAHDARTASTATMARSGQSADGRRLTAGG